jgi:uncharacterized protein YndB with AHSA1/START domain
MDVRPGGDWRLVMRGPDGRDYKNRLVFLEVVRPERLVYKHEPEEGCEPVGFEVTVTFAARGGKTEVTMRMLFPSAEQRKFVVTTYGAVEGAHQTLGRLAEHLENEERKMAMVAPEGDPLVVITRLFDAPRGVVFAAWTDPAHVTHWWGRRPGASLSVCEIDLRAGGEWRYVLRDANGAEHAFRGAYREVDPPQQVVYDFLYDADGWRDRKSLVTVTFEESDGRTLVTQHILHESIGNRDAYVHGGMEQGSRSTYDALATYLGGLS